MQITLFTKPKAIVTLVFAAIFLLDANLILTYLGIDLNDGGLLGWWREFLARCTWGLEYRILDDH